MTNLDDQELKQMTNIDDQHLNQMTKLDLGHLEKEGGCGGPLCTCSSILRGSSVRIPYT